MEKHLHIITLNVPWPADYGGVFDLFYKLPALQEQGVKIHLHCFDYGRGEQPELNKYCATVHYYRRKKWSTQLLAATPYIVATRKNQQLLNNLLKDDYPILMEGIHCSWLLNDTRFKQRKKYVRLHNVEYDYYQHLSTTTPSLLKKWFFQYESRLLRRYEQTIVPKATAFWTVTPKDAETYQRELGCTTASYLPLFLPPQWRVNGQTGTGDFCLYQGDLSVAMNEQVAIWLTEKVFAHIEVPFIIAGKNPGERLQRVVSEHAHIRLVANPGEQEMQRFITEAQVNVLPSYSNTGIKLKLLNALFNGRHCIVNDATIEGTGLTATCTVANTALEVQSSIDTLFKEPFTDNDLLLRRQLLEGMFHNEANARKLVQWIWA